MYSITILNSIQKVKKEEWDSMIEDNAFASYGWLKTVEETFIGGLYPYYILVKDCERPIAAAVCYLNDDTNLVENIDDLLFGRVKNHVTRLGISLMPTVTCYPFFCYGKHFLVSKDLAPKESEIVMKKILYTIEQWGSKKRYSITFLNVINKEKRLIKLLNENNYTRVTHMPLSYIDIEWSSFKEYQNHIKKSKKGTTNAIRNEINRNRKKGVTIMAVENPEACKDRLYELLENNYYRHNQKPFMFKKLFITRLKENLGKDVVFYVALKKGIITGVSILLKKKKTGFGFMLGIDHELAGNDLTYFNIAYYKPIMDAISEQMTRLYFGAGMYEPKARRGCKIDDVYFYYKPFNRLGSVPAKLWFAIFSYWMKCKLPKIAG